MQFVTHRDPVNIGGGATALGAAGDVINNLLGIYGGYKNKQLEEKRYQQEMAMKQDELRLRQQEEERRAAQEELANAMAARQIQEQEAAKGTLDERGQVKVGTRTVDAAPDFKVDDQKPAAATPFGNTNIGMTLGQGGLGGTAAAGDAAHKSGGATGGSEFDTSITTPQAQPTAKPPLIRLPLTQPTKTEDVMGPAPIEYQTLPEIRDRRGNVMATQRRVPILTRSEATARDRDALLEKEITEGRQVRLTPGERSLLVARGLGDRETMPAAEHKDLMDRILGSTKAPEHQVIGGSLYERDPQTGKWEIKVHGAEKLSASDKKALKDEQEGAMISGIRPGDPDSIPAQYRAIVIQTAEGRGVVPRGGNPGLVNQMAAAYNGNLDISNVMARRTLRQELTKGSASARGGQVSRINQFAGHLNDLQDANDKINEHLANSDWQTLNWLDQKLTRSGKKGPLAAYNQWANTVINEYSATLKGGAPTDNDIKMFQTLRDTTASPAERQAVIDAMKLAIEERANAQESVWKQTFGKSSVESGQPMFNENYRYDPDTGVWRHQRRGLLNKTKGESEDAEARKKRLLNKPGENTLGAPQTTYGLSKPPGV